MDRDAASRIRKAILDLRQERHGIEEELLECRELLRGCLVAHTILRGGYRRRQPAFYLYRVDEGRRRMIYVKKPDLEKARRQVEAYRRYQKGLRRLRRLARDIVESFKELRESEDAFGSNDTEHTPSRPRHGGMASGRPPGT
jgi:hypothetical protein